MSETIKLSDPISNNLLAALPVNEYRRMLSKLESFPLDYGETIYKRGAIIRYVYFPNSGIISLLAAVEDKDTLEVGIVGKEGMAGLAVFLGVNASNNLAIVQGAGFAMRMKAEELIAECQNGGALPRILQRFTHSLLTQVSQSATCYRFHQIEERLARWLLMTSDRMGTRKFEITQEFLANMLGVRREAVNKSAMVLEQKNLIAHTRGHISITDRKGLAKASCKCYRIIKDEERGCHEIKEIQ